MDIIELILKWLKPEVSFIIGETDPKLNQVIEKVSVKTLKVTSSYPVEINNIDFIYTTSVIDINLYPLQNDGFVLATPSMLSQVKHDSRYEYVTFGEFLIIKRTICQVEWLPSYLGIEITPGKESESYTPIYLRNLPPPLETFQHCDFLKLFMAKLEKPVYLEYGVGMMTSANAVKSVIPGKNCHCVDINDKPIPFKELVNFYQMYTDQFSKDILPKLNFNVAFIDADHKSESAFKDFVAIFKHIPKDSYIFLHDTYPYDPELLAPYYCNDCYKTPILIKNFFGSVCEVLTLPFNPGFTIVRKI